jgi:hypothetical protein
MAEQAGLLDFYNYVYTPFSQCAHSTWYHVGRYNSAPSEAPTLDYSGFRGLRTQTLTRRF